mmetsp:Transcript_55873/g.130922  ORF Transcript_55873/g.130922 Transcript_55873/m.130922 type:complete len:227 (+) Transcript_55873:1789-2469(+)
MRYRELLHSDSIEVERELIQLRHSFLWLPPLLQERSGSTLQPGCTLVHPAPSEIASCCALNTGCLFSLHARLNALRFHEVCQRVQTHLPVSAPLKASDSFIRVRPVSIIFGIDIKRLGHPWSVIFVFQSIQLHLANPVIARRHWQEAVVLVLAFHWQAHLAPLDAVSIASCCFRLFSQGLEKLSEDMSEMAGEHISRQRSQHWCGLVSADGCYILHQRHAGLLDNR